MPDKPRISQQKKASSLASGVKTYADAERLLQLAFVLPSAVVIGWLGGSWAAERWHQRWMMLAGVLFGCVSGLYYVVQQAIAAERAATRAEQAARRKDKGKESSHTE
jgi:uncharacterized membrane protein YfcA